MKFKIFLFALLSLSVATCNGYLNQSDKDAKKTPPGQVAAPAFTPPAGPFNPLPANVAIQTDTAGATLCYTTDGTSPSCAATKTACAAGTVYSAAVTPITNGLNIKAMACKAEMDDSAVTSGVYTFDNTAPGPVTNLKIITYNGQIALSWTNPGDSDLAGIKVLRKLGSDPTGPTDGTVVFNAMGTSIMDTGLTDGTIYYYKAFAYDQATNYATGVSINGKAGIPMLIASTPTNSATGVAVCSGAPCTAKIVLQFSESMQTTTPTLTTEVESATGTWVVTPNTGSTFTWGATSATNDTLTITLSWYWFPENSNIRYTIAAADLKDGAGNTIAAQVQQTFKTTWAGRNFTIADTGQTTCSSGASGDGAMAVCPQTITGQDGDFANTPNARSFTGPTQHATYTSDYTTKDNTTGLVWKTCSEGLSGATCATGTASTMSWNNAVNQCAALNTANSGAGYAGIKTWRLPTSAELETIIDYGVFNPSITAAYFPATVASSWSSTAYVFDTSNAWLAAFGFGYNYSFPKTNIYSVRCVTPGPYASPAPFTDNGNGTVTDSKTGLIWQQCSVGLSGTNCGTGTASTQTWQTALDTCKNLTLAGKTWRLPSMNELLSIVDKNKVNPAIDTALFPATVASNYWSSTTYVNNTTNAWHVFFLNGLNPPSLKTSSYYVRCVSPGP